MTELERRAALASAIAGPNASYDSAIDSLPDECYCDLTSPSVSFRRSSLVGSQKAGHMALSPSTAAASSTAAPYQSSPQTSQSPSLNGPILNSNLNSSLNPTSQLLVGQPATNGAVFYRSLADYHRLYNNITSSRLTTEQVHSPSCGQSVTVANGTHRQIPTDPKTRTSMAMFLDQIDASSSVLHSGGHRSRLAESCSTHSATAAGHSSRRGATGTGSQKLILGSEQPAASASDIHDDGQQHSASRVRHPGQCLRQAERQRVCSVHSPTADTTLSASSLLRSSRSFTTSYRQRPNVTLIRRKSASERLAESRSKYIRSDLLEADDTSEANVVVGSTDSVHHSCVQRFADEEAISGQHMTSCCTMRLLRVTPTSTKSSYTSSSRLSPISDYVWSHGQEERCLCGIHSSHGNLVDRINNQLNKSKQYSVSSCPKKRVSPRNSDGPSLMSNGMSKLEMKLRELITIDSSNELITQTTTDQSQIIKVAHRPFPLSEAAADGDNRHLQQHHHDREDHHIYRAELKFIGSSTSSLSSMYSEPNHESLSPVENQFNHLPPCDHKFTVASSADPAASQLLVRSKSDVSPKKQQKVTEKYRSRHIERLLGSLGLDSNFNRSTGPEPDLSAGNRLLGPNQKSSQSSNVHPNSMGSPSHESLEYKRDSIDVTPRQSTKKPTSLSTPKSCSTNELSSLESSQLSTSEALFKSALNHSKSTSKLTFENLMIHQQNLASSRSCHNLVASLQNGPSVVERNARIIKWLFNCRKAMGQLPSAQLSTCS